MTFEEFEQKLVGASSREKAYNLAVGYLKDRPRVAEKVARYLALHPGLPERTERAPSPNANPDGMGKTFYARCSVCKGEIKWASTWYKCTVSTCNRTRIALLFCSTDCWDSHLPEARHRDPGFTEHRAPN